MKKLLMVAYHFPPQSGSSGLLRSLKFARYLPECGWLPVVLTVDPRAYDRTDWSQASEVPTDVEVLRTWAIDAQRHLSFRGRYPRWIALPDRWVSWCLSAVPAGLMAIYHKRIDIIYTTFPIATAVLIGLVLHRATGKPWVLDFRDSMTDDNYPLDAVKRRVYRWLERHAISRGSLVIFTAPSARRMYLDRYPQLRAEQCRVIPNGYDEEDFCHLEAATKGLHRPVRLLHSGLIYPKERDPQPFFRAVARLKRQRIISAATLRIDLRACGSEVSYCKLTRELGIDDLVHLLPGVPYREALRDSLEADGLLLMQAASCDHQVPAKVYEYLRVHKPILALTTQTGDTAALLRETGGATIVELTDEEAIYRALPQFLQMLQSETHPWPDMRKSARYNRRTQARELAVCLRRLVQNEQDPTSAS